MCTASPLVIRHSHTTHRSGYQGTVGSRRRRRSPVSLKSPFWEPWWRLLEVQRAMMEVLELALHSSGGAQVGTTFRLSLPTTLAHPKCRSSLPLGHPVLPASMGQTAGLRHPTLDERTIQA